ncbi:MAG: TonB-dependent receptor plug domain-containing protein, partial [Daejeonella sp.]|nr:TonB-dependent receptor plug domain-containing protein [Daejeonella sp.]
IEAPGYYFLSDQKDKAWADLDNLLLTQGWTGFSWPETLNQQKPLLFRAESEFSISGTVTNIFNKPVANSEVLLLSKKPFLFMDTLSNKEGRFTFRDFPLADTAVYMIQSRNKRGKSFNVGIEVDEFIPPVFAASSEPYIPWYINTDTLFIKSTRNTVHEQHRWDAPAGVNVLEEVVVTAKKFIKDSRNRNGPGNADYILDEQDMLKAKKKTLYEMLEERFPGFRSGKGLSVKDFNSTDTMRYVLMQSYVNLVIDGVNISSIGATEEIYMDYLTAEDITGIEILKTPKYASVYDPSIASKMRGCMRCPPPPIFLEITTRSGNGAFLKKTPGVYLYKPIPYSFPAEFYRPKYPLKKIESIADLRSAIHWEPNIITDAEGKATISFYAADLPGYYSIVLEGTDMNGGIGMGRKKIEVRK